jgi:hypothetical protein
VQASFEVLINGKKSGSISDEFLKLGTAGVRAFAYKTGNEIVQKEIRKGNELAGMYVDGYSYRPVKEMKRNIVWEFAKGNSQLKRAVRDAIEQLRSYSLQYGGQSTGSMANSWSVYVNGKPTTYEQLDSVDLEKDDVRVTSHLQYTRWLESGRWTGTKILERRSRNAQRQSLGKKVRSSVAVTKTVAMALKRKYKSIYINDEWYDQNPFGYNFGFGKGRLRWPAIRFQKPKGSK